MKLHMAVVVAGLVGGVGAGTALAGKPTPPPSCGTDVQVVTQVAGTATDRGGNAMVSDGGGAYYTYKLSRTNKVEGRFQIGNCSHDYTLFLFESSRSIPVYLANDLTLKGTGFNIDRVASVPLTVNNDANLAAWCDAGRQTDSNGRIIKDPALGYLDNYGGCGTDERGSYVRRAGRFLATDVASGTGYDLFRQHSPQDTGWTVCENNPAVCDGSYVRVYHPDASTWIIRAVMGDEVGLGTAIISGGEFQRFEQTPVEITVTIP